MFSPLIDLLEGWSRLVTEDLYICMLSQPRNKNDHKLAPKGREREADIQRQSSALKPAVMVEVVVLLPRYA